MSKMHTYIFGNPSGWALYEGDPAEQDYFRSFYVISRHGSRMMVNRRDDGSVVYTYVRYDMIEGSDRKGAAHFGMSVILHDGSYTPMFSTVYRFMDTLFAKVLQRDDSPFSVLEGNVIRYNVLKLEDRRECIEWIKATLPRIFEKTGLVNLADDTSFAEGQAGRVAMFANNASDETVMQSFRKNNWIALSSTFKAKASETSGTEANEEVNLFDILRQHSSLTKTLLDISTGVKAYDSLALDKIGHRIDESRSVLLNYKNSSPADAKETDELLQRYSELLVSLDAVRNRPSITGATGSVSSPPIDPDKTVPPGTGDTPGPSTIHTSGPKQLSIEPITRFISKNLSQIVGVSTIIIFVILFTLLLRNCHPLKPALQPGEDPINVSQYGINPDPDPADDSFRSQFQDLINARDLSQAYALIKDHPDRDSYESVLDKSIKNHLWSLVETDNGEVLIVSFFTENDSMLDDLRFSDENDNGIRQWTARAQNYATIKNILSRSKISKADYEGCKNLIESFGDRYASKGTDLENKYRSQQQTAPPKEKQPTKDEVWVKVDKIKTNFNGDRRKGVGFDVIKGSPFTITSSHKIEIPNGMKYNSVNTGKTEYRITINTPNTYKFKIRTDKNTYPVTITVK